MAKKQKRTQRRKAKRPGGAKRVVRRVVKIRYSRTKQGRVRFQPISAAKDDWSVSYASRQGARRAARRAFKPSTVVAVVAA